MPKSSRASKKTSKHHICRHVNPPSSSHTCPHPYHTGYSDTNLPPLLFRMEPPPLPEKRLPPVKDLQERGDPVWGNESRKIGDFPFLPRYITTRPEGWLLEYWMRTDPRLTYRDIKARMVVPRGEKPMENALNMRRERDIRGPLGLSCWTARRGNATKVSRIDVERVEKWTLDQIRFNTTMDIEYRLDQTTDTLVPFRLRSKSLGGGGEPRYYPLDTFLDNGSPHVPSQRLLRTLQIFHGLAEKAAELGLDHWSMLPDSELPEWWVSHRNNARAASAAMRRKK